MNKNVIFAVALVLLFAGTSVAFAVTTATTSVPIAASGVNGDAYRVRSLADAGTAVKLRYSTGAGVPYTHVAPAWTPVVDEAGVVTAGDVYYIDTTGYLGDVRVTLFFTNTDELIKNYNYLNLKINVWSSENGAWVQAHRADATDIGTVYLTLSGGYTSFTLNGNTEYCLTVDGGNYYCIDTDAAGGSLSPAFFIDINPL